MGRAWRWWGVRVVVGVCLMVAGRGVAECKDATAKGRVPALYAKGKDWTWTDVDGCVRTRAELEELLRQHQFWIETDHKKGQQADLTGANLYKAELTKADLSEADLSGADLSEADLSGADLNKADLIEADLNKADLIEANLSLQILLEQTSVGQTLPLQASMERTLPGLYINQRGGHSSRESPMRMVWINCALGKILRR